MPQFADAAVYTAEENRFVAVAGHTAGVCLKGSDGAHPRPQMSTEVE